ncbi:hypothetical protein RHSIM_Rhsim02G0091800 [Rhododendron simsii]|uniref:Uncharacterized protein n=1 Tax=Rhododendron simsii TaxID=118357 RepID=A0A834HCL1_RHOSS|nr:hypothetical protein RHSIM_Rhsim02G0091800 [Rhododendron simsii]
MESPWKGMWLPGAAPAKRKPLTEEDLAGLDDDYYEPDPSCFHDDAEEADCDLFDYGMVASPEEIAQAEKDWEIERGNTDPRPNCVHITVRREEDKEGPEKISADLYLIMVFNRIRHEIKERKEGEMGRANASFGPLSWISFLSYLRWAVDH